MELTSPVLGAPQISRRAVFLGLGGVTAALAASVVAAEPAHAAAPTTPADVITLAKSYYDNTLADMNKIWSSWYQTDGDWCADFVSWCLRGTDTGRSKGSKELYGMCTPVSAANVRQGDVVWYYNAGHIGLVRSHSDGTIRTVEGNAGEVNAAHTNKVKHYETPWSSAVKYARPKY